MTLTKKDLRSVSLFVGIFLILCLLADVLLKIPREQLRLSGQGKVPDWEGFYTEPKDSIELLFLGSSRSYNTFDPRVFKEVSGVNAYNLGTQYQSPLIGYFVLREALKTQRPKTVVLETYWLPWQDKDLSGSFFSAFPYMKFSRNKVDFLLATGLYDQSFYLLPIQSWHDGFFAIPKLLSRSFQQIGVYSGYRENIGTVTPLYGENTKDTVIDLEKNMDPRQLDYLVRLIELTEREGIDLVLVTTPFRRDRQETILNYPDIHAYVEKLSDEYGLTYLDYNIPKKGYPVFEDNDFYDPAHLNNIGSRKLSSDLALRLKNISVDPKKSQ